MKQFSVKDIDRRNFWINFFGCCFPNAYDSKEDVSAADLMAEECTDESESWWEKFTGYVDGVMEVNGGYLDNPTYVEEKISPHQTLKIEFHPGDTVYYINEEEVGNTGPDRSLKKIPYASVEKTLASKNGRQLFLLLLPLAYFESGETRSAKKTVCEQLKHYFSESLSKQLSACIVAGLIK